MTYLGRAIAFFALAIAAIGAHPAGAEAPPSLADRFEFKMISAGNNRPGVALDQLSSAVAVGLGRGLAPAEIAAATEYSMADIASRIDELIGEGLVSNDGDTFTLSFPVMTVAETPASMPVDPVLVAATADLIERELPDIRESYEALAGFEHVPFEDASLLILSDVLLDAWQINDVESEILGAERPARGGGNYYLALLEKADPAEEAFGIYGNHFALIGNVATGLYGNQRYSGPPNLVNLTEEFLTTQFGYEEGVDPASVRLQLAETLIAVHHRADTNLGSREIALLRHFALIDSDDRVTVPVFGMPTYNALTAIAAEFRPAYVALLRQHLPALRLHYAASSFATQGVSFEEYFIWWYHLYYSRVTDALVERGTIMIPATINSTYIGVLGSGGE
ncbi:MAG: hypothetical protein AAGE05_12775 [Pseudomonadota bacterium]